MSQKVTVDNMDVMFALCESITYEDSMVLSSTHCVTSCRRMGGLDQQEGELIYQGRMRHYVHSLHTGS